MSTMNTNYLNDVVHHLEYLGTILDSNPTPEKTKLLEEVVDAIFNEEGYTVDGIVIHKERFSAEEIMYMLSNFTIRGNIPCGTFQIIAGVIVKHIEY